VCCVVTTQPSTAREMVTAVEKMEKDVEAKRRKLNVAGINEKSQKYLKQLKGTMLSSLQHWVRSTSAKTKVLAERVKSVVQFRLV